MIAAPYFERIESARTAGDLFPDADAARATYRRLARIVHPDINPSDKERADKAFARLSELWSEYTDGKSGSRDLVYTTRRHTYRVGDLLARGDVSNVYRVEYEDKPAILKMARSPKNNDLIVNEITTLKTLRETVPEDHRIYLSEAIDSFKHRDLKTGKDRRAIVLEDLAGFVTLGDIARAYPAGINPRDLAWMVRRLWIALDIIHEANIAHGAVTPDNVMVHPLLHGVVLIDWSYAKPFGEKLEVGLQKYVDMGWYGTNYDKPLDHRLDIRQASHTLEFLLGAQSNVRPFRAFFNGCRVASAPPAGQLFLEFDELLERLYGQRKYRPFEMPRGWRKEP